MKRFLIYVLVLSLGLGLIPSIPAIAAEAPQADGVELKLDWKVGQLYDQPESQVKDVANRRYAIITGLNEGDTIKFSVPSDWGMWCYPADDNGAIGSNVYLGPKDGDTYTVQEVNGKMPNRLRVCIYSLPSYADITDEMMANCGLKFTLYAAGPKDLFAESTWNVGSYYSNKHNNVTSRRYTVIPCSEGDTFTFDFSDKNFGLWVYYYDQTGELTDFGYTAIESDQAITITEKNGKVPTELRITTFPIPDKTITDEVWSTFTIKCYRQEAPKRENLFSTAEWQNGSYYGNAVHGGANRRYTIIPCKEYDTFTFDFTSTNFGLWVYYYDANGEITDFGYTTVNNDSKLQILSKNGKVPTELRISVYPIPDSTITPEMWATFDVKCYVEEGEPPTPKADYNIFRTADWKNGGYYNNAVQGGANRRHAIFPCKENDTFTFTFNNTNFGLWIYYYDENGEITDLGYTAAESNKTITVTAKNGRVPTELRITVFPKPDNTITEEMWKKFDITCTQSSDYITVATMNYGLWYDGSTKYVPDDEAEETLAKWKKMLDDNDADILAGQEWLEYFDRSNTMLVKDHLFAYKYLYQYNFPGMKTMVSKTECTDITSTTHSQNTSRSYTKAYTVINGRKVCLINAHCSTETDFNINRKSEFQELINAMKNEEYVILFGDFNTYTVSEFDIFKEAGYSLANCGEFGNLDTWTNFDHPHSWTNKAIDNIIVSPNIQILNARVDRRDLSDHSMLVAELHLLDEAPDKEAPMIAGIEDNGTYTGAVTVTATDNKGIASITVNGSAVYPKADEVVGKTEISFELAPAEGQQTVVVTDQAGNTTTYTVTVKEKPMVGDFTGDNIVTDEDVIYLLWYTVFPNDYPLNQSGDINGDGVVSDEDVIYLLWYTVFPEDYPLTK